MIYIYDQIQNRYKKKLHQFKIEVKDVILNKNKIYLYKYTFDIYLLCWEVVNKNLMHLLLFLFRCLGLNLEIMLTKIIENWLHSYQTHICSKSTIKTLQNEFKHRKTCSKLTTKISE